MSFVDALNAPLPSKKYGAENLETEDMVLEYGIGDEIDQMIAAIVTESDDLDDDEDIEDVTGDDVTDLDDSDDLGDTDPDDLDDDELAELDAELSGDALKSAAGIDDDDDSEEKLTPSEELQADDMMAVAATTMLVNDEMNAEERTNFIESGEAKIAVTEGFMTEADVDSLANDLGMVTEAKYSNKMIIRLNAEAKKKQLFALAVNVSAAAHNDPDYKKLRKVMRVRKILRERLTKKYQSEATKRMKIYFARLRKSKSPVLARIGAKKK